MKNKIVSTILIAIMVLSFSFGALSADISPAPDALYTASKLLSGQSWIKGGTAITVGEGDDAVYKFMPNVVAGNGFGFVVDVPVEKANYVVIRQYTNLCANQLNVIYSHDSSFDFTMQYGSVYQTYTTEDRVLTFNMTDIATKVKGAGETSVKYFKLTPWSGQRWEPEAGKSFADYAYALYSIAFFADKNDADAYAKALEASLPAISEDEELLSLYLGKDGVTSDGTDISSPTSAPEISDNSALGKMINEFKSKRVDDPFIKGYDNGTTFKPDGNMTRAEACTIITRLLTAEEAIKGKYTSKFTDVKAGAWYYDNIAYLENKGYLDSYSGSFKPDQKITRAEFVELVYNMGVISESDKEVSFTDVPATHPRYDVIMAAAKSGLVNGKSATTFDPDGDIKRSEVVKVICTALGRTPTKDGIIKVDGFKDVPASHWAYPYIIDASYRHSLTVQEDGTEKWNKLVENELIIYPEYPAEIDRDYMFEVSVTQGYKTAKIPVYDETRQFASTRTPYGDDYRRFCEFAFSGEPVRIDVTVNESFSEYTLIPAIKDIPSTVNGNVISIYVDEPMQLVLRLGSDLKSYNKMLAIFVDPPEENIPDKNADNVIWVEGWYDTPNGELNLTSGQTLYIAPGAVCNARVLGSGDNITITGRGMVRDPYDTRTLNKHGYNYVINLKNGKNIKVEGIKIVDCRFYHLYFNNIVCGEIYNVKAFSNQISTDGFNVNGSNIYFHDSFADVGDDVFTGGGSNKLYEELVVGSTCGVFSLGGVQSNNIYRNISIFRADEAIFKNFYSTGAFSGSYFENIYAVDCPFTPFFISSKNQEGGLKQFNFKNVSINTPSGIDDKAIEFRAYPHTVLEIRNGSEFEFNLENFYIDGNLITDAKDVKIVDKSDTGVAEVNVSVNGKNNRGIPLTANTTVLKVPYVAPEKEVVPLAPGENAVINGGFEEGAIAWSTANFCLLEIVSDANSGKRAMFVPATDAGMGVNTSVTDGIIRGGEGEYLIEFYAKKSKASKGSTINAKFEYNFGTSEKYKKVTKVVNSEKFELGDKWQKYSFVVKLNKIQKNRATISFLYENNSVEFFIDDVSVTKLP